MFCLVTDGELEYRQRLHPPGAGSGNENGDVQGKGRRKKGKHVDKLKQIVKDLLSFDESSGDEWIKKRQPRKARQKHDPSSMAVPDRLHRPRTRHRKVSLVFCTAITLNRNLPSEMVE